MRAALPLLLALAACAELPPVEGTVSPAAQAAPAPQLAPLASLLATRAAPSRAAAQGLVLDARAAGLRREAAGLPVPDGPAPGTLDARADALRATELDPDLAARGEALRARAEALRAAPL